MSPPTVTVAIARRAASLPAKLMLPSAANGGFAAIASLPRTDPHSLSSAKASSACRSIAPV